MSQRIAVLYEDQLATAKPKNFGPHVLMLACLADRIGRDREQLTRHIEPLPRKGVDKLISTCAQPGFGDLYARVVAVCDDDRVREHLGLPVRACKTQVRAALVSRCSWPERLHPVVLERNLETLVDAVCRALGRAPPTSKPRPPERDGILLHLAFQGTTAQRDELRHHMPSFGYLVERLARILAEP